MLARCSPLLPLVASLALCFCGADVAVAPQPPLEAAAFAAAYAHAYCSALGGCCAGIGQQPASSCEPTVASQVQADLDGAATAGAVYDSDAARGCVDALAATACPTIKTSWLLMPAVCEKIFNHKPTAKGSPCSSRWQCADAPPAEGWCQLEANGGRKCVLSTPVDPGATCVPSMPSPDEYLSCKLCDSETGTCWALGKLGEPCITGQNWGDTCVPGALCDRAHTKTCVKPKAVGEACDSVEECEGLACKEGHCQSILWVPDGVCAPP